MLILKQWMRLRGKQERRWDILIIRNGIEIPIAAAAMGAVVIEKHFTLDRNMEGPDHKASLEPDELSKMVSSIRNIEKAMGDG